MRKNKINICSITGILFSMIICTAFKPPKKEPDKPVSVTSDKPLNHNNTLLWQISGAGLTKPSYLFGTIHLIDRNNYFLGKNVRKKITHAEELILEIDLEHIDSEALTKLSVLDSGKSIKNYMNDTDYLLLQTFMEDSIGIKKYTFEMFYSKLKPFYIEQLIFFRYLGQEKESYEQNFKKIADEKKIPQSGLETFEEQLLFLEDIPLSVQLKSLTATIRDYSTETRKMDTLIDVYLQQDITSLSKIFEEDEDTILKEKLVDKRNSSWIPKLKLKMATKSCFIAVGAGHLGGESGLISLLRQQGYTVEPISAN